MDCANCGKRIVQLPLSGAWMHQIKPDPDRTSWDELVYTFCKLSVAEPGRKVSISKEDLITDRSDMISVVREELRQNVGESLIKKDRGDLLEIVILTKENVSNVAKETGRSEQALRDALSHAKVMDRVCYIAYRYLE